MITEVALRIAPVVVGGGVWLEPERLVIVRNGSFMITEVALRIAPVVVGGGGVRFKEDGLVVVGNGRFILAEGVLRVAPVVVGGGVVRLEPECSVVSKNRFFNLIGLRHLLSLLPAKDQQRKAKRGRQGHYRFHPPCWQWSAIFQ